MEYYTAIMGDDFDSFDAKDISVVPVNDPLQDKYWVEFEKLLGYNKKREDYCLESEYEYEQYLTTQIEKTFPSLIKDSYYNPLSETCLMYRTRPSSSIGKRYWL